MIRYNPKSWFTLIFHSYSRYVFKKLIPTLLFLAVYTGLLVYLIEDVAHLALRATTAVHSILGIVLGLFLVFRTNSAYEKWWEGRIQWGSLVNESRNLSLKLNSILDPNDHQERQKFTTLISSFGVTLKEHLRKEPDFTEYFQGEEWYDDFQKAGHKPNFLSKKIQNEIYSLKKKGTIDGFEYMEIQKNADALTDVLGACERIRNTPIPYSYSMFVKKFIFFFMITLPFGFMGDFHYWTIAIVLLLAYILLGTELIAEEIEEPFGGDINDLPTEYLSNLIGTNVSSILLN